MDPFLGLAVGIGLAAACGFRIFVPLLVMSIAANSGNLQLAAGFEWIATPEAMFAFGTATALEIAAYYIPAVDNLLDTVATPSAAVAGTIVTAACVANMDPFLTWSLAAIGGGGSALAVQGATTLTRFASTAGTGGLGNPLVSTAEAGGSATLSVLALAFPFVAAAAVLVAVFFIVKKAIALTRGRSAAKASAGPKVTIVDVQETPALPGSIDAS